MFVVLGRCHVYLVSSYYRKLSWKSLERSPKSTPFYFKQGDKNEVFYAKFAEILTLPQVCVLKAMHK